MKLYRYFASHAKETLERRELFMAAPSSLNDPFEFLYAGVENITTRQAQNVLKNPQLFDSLYKMFRARGKVSSRNEFKRRYGSNSVRLIQNNFSNLEIFHHTYPGKLMDQFFRICSFSNSTTIPEKEVLLWSHYANKHNGIRIGFEMYGPVRGKYVLEAIKYKPTRLELDFTKIFGMLTAEALGELLTTKCETWDYENEYRLLVKPSDCRKVTEDGIEKHFIPFDASCIWTVDFGLRFPASERDAIIPMIRSGFPAATIRQAVAHKKKFVLEYQQIAPV